MRKPILSANYLAAAMNEKQCSRCKVTKDASEFYASKTTKDGLRSLCKKCTGVTTAKYQKAHPEERREVSRRHHRTHLDSRHEYQREHRRKVREKVISHYGGKCACCGETQYEFLAIDHINGGGNKHRKSLGGNNRIAAWIIKNNYPSDFRLLCHNCNQALGRYGYCPHQPDKKQNQINEK